MDVLDNNLFFVIVHVFEQTIHFKSIHVAYAKCSTHRLKIIGPSGARPLAKLPMNSSKDMYRSVMRFSFKFPNSKVSLSEIQSTTPDIEKQMYTVKSKQCETKNMIATIERHKWDMYRKVLNPYETVKTTSFVTLKKPISRAYYKLMEICVGYELLNEEHNLDILCVAEGPGAFIQAIADIRKNAHLDKYICNTLISQSESVPTWNKDIFSIGLDIHTYTGIDGTGDICNIRTVKDIITQCKVDLFTGDGGIDVSDDYNTQDLQCMQLIFSELIIGVGCMKMNGTMVIKLFDIYDKNLQYALFIISTLFKETFLTKPLSSRPANSEKYYVCKGFCGSDPTKIEIISMLMCAVFGGDRNQIDMETYLIQHGYDITVCKSFFLNVLQMTVESQCETISAICHFSRQYNPDVSIHRHIQKKRCEEWLIKFDVNRQ